MKPPLLPKPVFQPNASQTSLTQDGRRDRTQTSKYVLVCLAALLYMIASFNGYKLEWKELILHLCQNDFSFFFLGMLELNLMPP